MNKQDILNKIGIIREQFGKRLTDQAMKELVAMEKKVLDTDIRSRMTDNPLAQELRDELQKEIGSIEEELKTQKLITEEHIIGREVLFAKLNIYKLELAKFAPSKVSMDEIGNKIDNSLKNLYENNKAVGQ